MDSSQDREVRTEAEPRPPRRSTNPRERAPIDVEQAIEHTGSVVIVEGLPEQSAVVRRHILSRVSWRQREAESLLLLASELFNNAITHTRSGDPGGDVTVAIIKIQRRVQIKVIDQGPRHQEIANPHVRPLQPDRPGGLGLRLVATQANRWGTVHHETGTTVWFEIDRDARR
ncbi:ATP-binding protein [Nocardiopsis sp. NRRL B-16309]|uniref:ATP-binding protein n=1 Tax=Nocardiopsis sp. NRRL B-16309 TaxID=1519494 RepID=UPI0018D1A6CC|nr:ATP-binding protein [Nocardiopsis sp. NRRL B-16309]